MSLIVCTVCERRIAVDRISEEFRCRCGSDSFMSIKERVSPGVKLVKQSFEEYMAEKYPHIFGEKNEKPGQ